MVAAERAGACPSPPADCPLGVAVYPCVFDPGDVPFLYFPSARDQTDAIRDLARFDRDLASSALPAVSFLKVVGYRTEHPGGGTKLSVGVAAAMKIFGAISASPEAASTLVLLTYDEGGGYFDHIAPPAASAVDAKAYGPRVPLLAVGPFARKNSISHTTLEHSSIVKFIEWNWLGEHTGQLGQRDTVVANIGSLLDPATTGKPVPEE
jgi:phospholipase C